MKKIILAVLALIVIFFVYKEYTQQKGQSSPSGGVTTSTPQENPSVKKVSTGSRRITEETGAYEIKVVYPQVQGIVNTQMQEKVNASLKEFADNTVAEFKKQIQEIVAPPAGQKSGLFMDYTLVQLNQKMVSVRFNVSNYTAGAAHPNNYVHGWTYDLVNDKSIAGLEDIFDSEQDYLKRLSDLARENIKNQFNADWPALQSDVMEGTEPTQENFSEFSVGINTFNLYFNPYQVAPYAVGLVEVKITYPEIKDILREDFVLKPE